MGYKVLVPTAGTGSRLQGLTKYLNKSLVDIAGKPALARIIDMFPIDCEFVIPTGYKGDLIKEFIFLAYPHRKVTFTDVSPYEGDGSGLGLSILSCKEYLQEPFVFCSCDTLVVEAIPDPYRDWIGYGERDTNLKEYRTVGIKKNRYINAIYEKGMFHDETVKPYIGLAGIHNYKLFWKTMEDGGSVAITQGESYGLNAIVKHNGVQACGFTWFDTGVKNELEKTKEYFREPDAPNILEKADESIWFMNNQVIKFSANEQFITQRVERAEMLKEFVPPITGFTKHMYAYGYVGGEVLSKAPSVSTLKKLLNFSQGFWKIQILSSEQKREFQFNCEKFYHEKTYDRVLLFYKNFEKVDKRESINGVAMPTLKEILDHLDWTWVEDGLPGRFHGDYHFENILYDKNIDNFCFLDWRQNFGSSIEIGDIYYDLGKLLHGLIMCHELIAQNCYKIEWSDSEINFDFHRKESLVRCEQYFYKWLQRSGYDILKVKLMAALIFLNIAALHHHPYGLLLYALGKQMLYELTNNISGI